MDVSGKTFAPSIAWDPEVEGYLRGALGDERFHRTAAALSRPPRTTCLRVNTLRTSPQEVLARVLEQLGPGAGPEVVQIHPQVPCAVILRGSGPHNVSYEATGGREVIVSRKAGEAVLRGARVFVPGVLAASAGVARGDLVALSVAREKPGSDTPEVTRGTTLYTALPQPTATTRAAPAATAATATTATAAAAVRAVNLASAGSDALPGPAVADEAPGTAGGFHSAHPADAKETHGSDSQPGRCHKRSRATAGVANDGPDNGVADGPAPSSAAVAAPAEPAPDLRQGWTNSSQGLIPPRTGMYVGLARAVMSRQEMFRSREGVALELVEPVFRVPPAVGGLPSGWVMLQNLPSLVAALALAPAPGSRVLDMCAAPGGKTTLLAQIMGDQGEIVAFDRTHAKAQDILSLAQELGVTCIKARKMDAGKALERPTTNTSTQDHSETAATPAAAVGYDPRVETGSAAAPSAQKEGSERCGSDAQGTRGSGHVDEDSGDPCSASAVGTGGAVTGSGGSGAGAAAAGKAPLSEKARLREERRRAAMLKRGITPPEPRDAALTSSGPAAYPPESFDHVLLDAPCSALGLRPRLQQQATALYLRQCAAAQRRLIDSAVRLLRVGGHLVYSTCTINPGENEACVRYLLDRYGSSFKLVPAGPPRLGSPGLVGRHPAMVEAGRPIGELTVPAGAAPPPPGDEPSDRGPADGCAVPQATASVQVVSERGGEAWLTEAEAALVQRFDPSDPELDTIGFFVAMFLKVGPVPGR